MNIQKQNNVAWQEGASWQYDMMWQEGTSWQYDTTWQNKTVQQDRAKKQDAVMDRTEKIIFGISVGFLVVLAGCAVLVVLGIGLCMFSLGVAELSNK